MITPLIQAENCYVLNVENDKQGQGAVKVMHYTAPDGRERVEVHVEIDADTTADWALRKTVA